MVEASKHDFNHFLQSTWGSVSLKKLQSKELNDRLFMSYDRVSLNDIQHILVHSMKYQQFDEEMKLNGKFVPKHVNLQEFSKTIKAFDMHFKKLLEENLYLKERNQIISETLTKIRVGYFKEIRQFESLSFKLEN